VQRSAPLNNAKCAFNGWKVRTRPIRSSRCDFWDVTAGQGHKRAPSIRFAKCNRAAAIAFAVIYIPRFRGGSFLTVSYRATVLTKALVKVINDDDIARRGRKWARRRSRAMQPRTPLRCLINCHRLVICPATRGRGRSRSIALAYLIAAFIKTVMSRSFNEAAAAVSLAR